MAVDDAAIAIGALVEVENGVHAQVREVFAKFVQVFTAEYFFAFFEIGTAGHGSRSLISFAICSPIIWVILSARTFRLPSSVMSRTSN